MAGMARQRTIIALLTLAALIPVIALASLKTAYGPSEPATGLAEGLEEAQRGGMGKACASIGNKKPGQAIRWLLDNHDRFNWSLKLYPEEWRLEWNITAEDPEAADTLYYHVLQMECILENGGKPRAWDPVFKLEAELTEYIDTQVELIGDTTVRVVKTAENECAWETIKLHAEVVKGFFETGREEARKIHPIPEEVKEKCSQYLEE